MDDEILVKKIQQENDMYAFEILVKRYQEKIYNICYRFMGDRQEAFDCAQDTFVKIYENIKSFKHLSSFSTWSYRIAVNTCKNRLSSWQYQRMKKTFSLGEKSSDIQNNDSPAQNLEKLRIQEMVQKAIDALPFDCKEMIILRDIQQFSYEEIVKITGLPLGTVKSKIARAREKLKEILENLRHGL
ncbi:MAG: sigma-70 family RNA polymerase sigma factor [Candidatus Omnitrophica bacterium]|nr:sigma-70 family RNA polymerase sigma factor [Candidatus Omnitrophota bacterium]